MNNKSLTLIQMVMHILQNNSEQKFTAGEIAKQIFKEFPDWCENKRKNSKQDLSTDQKLIGQIISEIGSHLIHGSKKHPNLQTLEDKPRKYFYALDDDGEADENLANNQTPKSASDDVTELNHSSNNQTFSTINPLSDFAQNRFDNRNNRKQNKTNHTSEKEELLEHELYPLLAQYLHEVHRISSKRIDEKRSSNARGAGGNKWLFPDVVALEVIGSNWQADILECAKEYSAYKGKLWSFEVKRKIDSSNVREVFFQTVSNSSWANYAYLVTSDIISKGSNSTLTELQILAGLHGIGVIQLDINNIAESQILILAKEREIDWANANRLAEENKDFKDYISDVTSIYRNPRSKDRITKSWLPTSP